MFVHNWIKHVVRRGICQTCKKPFPGEGIVYAKGEAILHCTPVKFDDCKGELNG